MVLILRLQILLLLHNGLLKLKRLELLHIMLSKILKENSIWLLKRKMELML